MQEIKNSSKKFKENYEVFLKTPKGSYVGIVGILEDPQLSAQAKVLFHILSSLSFKEGYFYGTNAYLSKKINLSTTSVKKYLSELQKCEVIIADFVDTAYGVRRIIKINFAMLRKRYLKKQTSNRKSRFSAYCDEAVEGYRYVDQP